jgi:integrase
MNEFKFTNARLNNLQNTTGKDEEYKDTEQKSLLLRLTPAGNKIFRLKAWNKRKQAMTQMVIGHYPAISIATARGVVTDHLRDMAHGVDVAERARLDRAEQTLDDIFQVWLEEHAKQSCKRWDQEVRRYELYIKPHLGTMKHSDISPDVVRGWQNTLSKQKKQRGNEALLSKGVIHRAFIVLSSVFGKAAPQIQNPCSQVKKYKPTTRTTFLKSSELQRFFEALHHQETPEYLKDYLSISLYTGARRSNVLAMRWNHIDLNLKLWMIPGDEMKNTEPMVIPLLDQALEILKCRRQQASSVFVFPSPKNSKTGHFVEPKKAWKSLLKRAGLQDSFRLHDLRRTMGSWQAITGTSTKIIGASLGHKSEQATKHYAHLTIEPVRAAMQRAADAMDSQKTLEKVIRFDVKNK